jgi:hypothetical protein
MTRNQHAVIYQVDPGDLLVWFNEEWDLFAAENDGILAGSNTVRYRPLWEFISDSETRYIHEIFLRKVRSGRAIRNLSFRCDSPELRRFMEMDIALLADGNVEYRCRILRTDARDPVPFISAGTGTGERLLRMCSWCKKVDVGGGLWLEIEDAIARLDLFSKKNLPAISHGICGNCLQRFDEET